jgi:hypothetical protein
MISCPILWSQNDLEQFHVAGLYEFEEPILKDRGDLNKNADEPTVFREERGF